MSQAGPLRQEQRDQGSERGRVPSDEEELSGACPAFQLLGHWKHLILTTPGGDAGIIPLVQAQGGKPTCLESPCWWKRRAYNCALLLSSWFVLGR